MFLKTSQISQGNTCVRVSFLVKLPEVCNFIKKETLVQVFSCEFCEIFKNTFFLKEIYLFIYKSFLDIALLTLISIRFNDTHDLQTTSLQILNYLTLHFIIVGFIKLFIYAKSRIVTFFRTVDLK